MVGTMLAKWMSGFLLLPRYRYAVQTHCTLSARTQIILKIEMAFYTQFFSSFYCCKPYLMHRLCAIDFSLSIFFYIAVHKKCPPVRPSVHLVDTVFGFLFITFHIKRCILPANVLSATSNFILKLESSWINEFVTFCFHFGINNKCESFNESVWIPILKTLCAEIHRHEIRASKNIIISNQTFEMHKQISNKVHWQRAE